jgi:hypothetical protein
VFTAIEVDYLIPGTGKYIIVYCELRTELSAVPYRCKKSNDLESAEVEEISKLTAINL